MKNALAMGFAAAGASKAYARRDAIEPGYGKVVELKH